MVLVLVMTIGIAVVTLIISRLNVQKIKRINQKQARPQIKTCPFIAADEVLSSKKTTQDIYEDLKW